MNRERLEAEVRHYRRQHSRNMRERKQWLRIMEGRRTGQVMVFEHYAAQCRLFALEKIQALRELR